jgi:hypothetical protein
MTSSPNSPLPNTRLDASIAAEASSGQVVAESSCDRLPPIQSFQGKWERWFAWHPVRLYMTSRFAWLTTIYRRCVTKGDVASRDYTDSPEEFPS